MEIDSIYQTHRIELSEKDGNVGSISIPMLQRHRICSSICTACRPLDGDGCAFMEYYIVQLHSPAHKSLWLWETEKSSSFDIFAEFVIFLCRPGGNLETTSDLEQTNSLLYFSDFFRMNCWELCSTNDKREWHIWFQIEDCYQEKKLQIRKQKKSIVHGDTKLPDQFPSIKPSEFLNATCQQV